MKDEIKEILKDSLYNGLTIEYYKDLLNYITNLQEELQYQKEAELEYNDKHTKLMKAYSNLQEENERLKVNCNVGNENLTFYRNGYKDYKTRNEKAVEYIDKWKFEVAGNGACMEYEDIQELLKILQGKSDE